MSDQPAPPPRSPQPTEPPPGAAGDAPASAVEPQRPGLDDRVRGLDRQVVGVWRVVGALSALLPLAMITGLAVLLTGAPGWPVGGGALVLIGVLVAWYPAARWRRWRWQLTVLALELRHGVVIRTHEAVPYFRIQQIDINQGPLDRLLGLATLQVTTASASGSATLPGLAADDAPQVRAELLARAAEAVAEHPGELRDAV